MLFAYLETSTSGKLGWAEEVARRSWDMKLCVQALVSRRLASAAWRQGVQAYQFEGYFVWG
jgi:hypothetical protein